METSSTDVRDLVVVVVGAGRGLGRQYALNLAEAGARVVLTGRGDGLDAVALEIGAAGGQAIAVRCDIRDPAPFTDAAMDSFGRIDALVVNAGIVRDRSFAKMTSAEWADVIDVHLGGSFACAKAVWPIMTAQGRGAIVFTTSGAGLHGAFGQANYAAAKAGLIGLTKALALEGARLGIRVNAIAPMAKTEMTDAVFDERMKARLRPELVSPFLLELLSCSARMTGEIVECGGGWGARMRWQRAVGGRAGQTGFSAEYDLPSSTLDSLGAALGDPRTFYRTE